MTLALRPYQERLIADARAAFQRGSRAVLAVAPTGSGKTVCAARVIQSALTRGKRTLFCAGRVELVDQTVATLSRAGIIDVRVIQADRDRGAPECTVTVASVDTLRARADAPTADLLIFDEAHHGAARTWRGIADRCPGAAILGLTATPERGDGRALDLFDALVVGPTVRELTAVGSLTPCRIWAPPRQLETGKLALEPIDAWQQHAGGRRAAVFAASIQHARAIVEQFTSAGLSADLVTGTTPTLRRAAVLAAFAAGQLTALVSCGVLCEGWDDPECSVAIVARKIGHAGLWLQIGGRILRVASGKAQATLIDLAGNVHEHGPLDMDREYSLTGRGIRPAVIKDLIRQCAGCGSVALAGSTACPYCGEEYPRRAAAAQRITGDALVDATGSAPAPKREWIATIVSKYRGTCVRCGGTYARGDKIHWATLAKRGRHVSCPSAAEERT